MREEINKKIEIVKKIAKEKYVLVESGLAALSLILIITTLKKSKHAISKSDVIRRRVLR